MRAACLLLSVTLGCAEFPAETDAATAPEPDAADPADAQVPDPDDGVRPDANRQPPADAAPPVPDMAEVVVDRSACEAPAADPCGEPDPFASAAPLELVGGARGVSVAAGGTGFTMVWDGGEVPPLDLHQLRIDPVSGAVADRRDLDLPADIQDGPAWPSIATRDGVVALGWYQWDRRYKLRPSLAADDDEEAGGTPNDPTAARVALAATATRWHFARIQQQGRASVRRFSGGSDDLADSSVELAIAGGSGHALAAGLAASGTLGIRSASDTAEPEDYLSNQRILANDAVAVDIGSVPGVDSWFVAWGTATEVRIGQYGEGAAELVAPLVVDCDPEPVTELAVAVHNGGGVVWMMRASGLTVRRFRTSGAGLARPVEQVFARQPVSAVAGASLETARHADGRLLVAWVADGRIHTGVGPDVCP